MPITKQAIVNSNNVITNFAVWDGVSIWPPAGVTAGEISRTNTSKVGDSFHVRTGPYTHNIVIEGNSIAKGTLVGVNNTAAMLAVLDVGLTANDRICVAKDGWTTTALITDAFKFVDPLYETGGNNILIVVEGTNDMGLLAKTDVEAYNNIKSFCTTRKAQGWTTIVSTILPRGGGGANFETYRISVNTMIRDALAANESWIDAIADVAAHPIMGVDGGHNNKTFYIDNLHPTAAGYLEMKSYFADAINSVK